MKKIIIAIIMLIPTIALAQQWGYTESTNEMGDVSINAAYVQDNDTEIDAAFGVGYHEETGRVIVLKLADHIIRKAEIDIKIDDDLGIVTLPGVKDGSMIIAPPSKTLIYRLKKGKNVKVRVETYSGLYTIDFPLDGSTEAIDNLPR